MLVIDKHSIDDNKVIVATDNILELFEFFRWIESTQLFAVIQEQTRGGGWHGVMPTLVSDEITMSLKSSIPVSRATDLPVELILEFYSKYPLKETHTTIHTVRTNSSEIVERFNKQTE